MYDKYEILKLIIFNNINFQYILFSKFIKNDGSRGANPNLNSSNNLYYIKNRS